MSLQTRLASLVTSIGTDIKDLNTRLDDQGPPIYVRVSGDPIPPGLPVGTVVITTES